MITITDIRNRIRHNAESIRDLSGTVVNLKSPFTNSPNSTPEVAKKLNQAREDTEDAIPFGTSLVVKLVRLSSMSEPVTPAGGNHLRVARGAQVCIPACLKQSLSPSMLYVL